MKVTTVVFVLILLAGLCFSQEAEERALWEEKGYFSVGLGSGVAFPIGRMGEVMDVGLVMEACADYTLNFSWGALGFGLCAEVLSETTNDDVTSPYNLIAIPVAVGVRYDTRFMLPFYLASQLRAGVSVNVVSYRTTEFDDRDTSNVKFFLAPAVGAGLYINRELGVSIWESIPMLFFETTPFIGSSLIIRVEYYL